MMKHDSLRFRSGAASRALLTATLLCVSSGTVNADNDCTGKGSIRLVNGKIHTMDRQNRGVLGSDRERRIRGSRRRSGHRFPWLRDQPQRPNGGAGAHRQPQPHHPAGTATRARCTPGQGPLGSDLLFPLRSQEPSVVRRIEAQNLLAGDGLAGAPESGPR